MISILAAVRSSPLGSTATRSSAQCFISRHEVARAELLKRANSANNIDVNQGTHSNANNNYRDFMCWQITTSLLDALYVRIIVGQCLRHLRMWSRPLVLHNNIHGASITVRVCFRASWYRPVCATMRQWLAYPKFRSRWSTPNSLSSMLARSTTTWYIQSARTTQKSKTPLYDRPTATSWLWHQSIVCGPLGIFTSFSDRLGLRRDQEMELTFHKWNRCYGHVSQQKYVTMGDRCPGRREYLLFVCLLLKHPHIKP